MAGSVSQGIERIPDQQGHLVVTEDGAVLSSSGDLENDEKTAHIICNMLHTAAKVPLGAENSQAFKRLSIVYGDFMLMATVCNQKIYVVKRPVTASG